MGNRLPKSIQDAIARARGGKVDVPIPTASYRRRGWLEFQRALDPLAPPKPPPRPPRV